MRVLEVEIKNWNKFNPRSDAKSCAWFRMSNDFFNDPEFYGASLEARMLWMFLLCSASKKMSPKIKINTQMIADNLAVRVESIDFALEALFHIGCLLAQDARVISISSKPNVKKMLPDVTCPNVTNVTERNEHNVTNVESTKKHSPKTEAQEILNHWNMTVKGAGHDGTKIQLKKISESLEKLRTDFSLEQIKQGVSNYFTVLYGEEYFYSYQFSCWDFLARKNNVNFMPGLFILTSYQGLMDKNNRGKSSNQSHRIQSNVTDAEMAEAKQLGIL